MTANDRWAARAGWDLTAERVAKSPDGLDLPALLARIESEMASADPEVQWTMNNTLAAIGIHFPKHRKRAIVIGETLGIYRDDRVTVDAFRVPHGKWEHAFGFRFRTPDKIIVISGDTAFSPTIAEHCNGCDILVHEGGITGDNSAYFRASHTSAEELVRVAATAKPKLLVLYHQRNANEDGLRIIRSGFQGPVVVATDLQVFE